MQGLDPRFDEPFTRMPIHTCPLLRRTRRTIHAYAHAHMSFTPPDETRQVCSCFYLSHNTCKTIDLLDETKRGIDLTRMHEYEYEVDSYTSVDMDNLT
jgi:hypothetical protein